MKKYLALFYFGLFLPLYIQSQEIYSLETVTFLPPMYYVGDEVELRLKVIIQEDYELKETDQEIKNEWIDITKVYTLPPRKRDGKKIYEVRIFFVSFKPGVLSLPDIPLGGLTLKDIEINTLSVFSGKEKIEKLKPPRGQLELPYTWVKIGLIILLIVLISVLIVILIIFLPRWFFLVKKVYMKNFPIQRLRRGLAKLRRICGTLKPRVFFISLSGLIREYLNNRLLIPALTSTTAEISSISSASIMEKQVGQEVVKVLTLSDFVKFGGRNSNKKEMWEVLDRVHFLVNTIEEEKKSVEP
jgi:hypothetical protein